MSNTMRQEYKQLTDLDKENMKIIKDAGQHLHDLIEQLGSSRETSLAKTKVEEAVMWAVKHITA